MTTRARNAGNRDAKMNPTFQTQTVAPISTLAELARVSFTAPSFDETLASSATATFPAEASWSKVSQTAFHREQSAMRRRTPGRSRHLPTL